jgi:hypothetical protein
MRRAHDPNFKERTSGLLVACPDVDSSQAFVYFYKCQAFIAQQISTCLWCPASCVTYFVCCVLLPAGKPGTKRDLDGNEMPQKRGRAAAAAAGGGDGQADMDVSLPSPSLSVPARAGERVWHRDEHTVFVKGMGFQVHEQDLRQLFADLAIRAVRVGMDRETGQARVSGACVCFGEGGGC